MAMEKIVILGAGPAGLTAAIYAARAALKPILITGPAPGGQLALTSEVENFPGFPDGISGYKIMELMQKQSERFGAVFRWDKAESVKLRNGGPHEITLLSGETIFARALIIATGASPRWLGLEAEKRLFGAGVSACATCDGAFYQDKTVVVAGGGDSACEEASFLTRFAGEVHLVHRRDRLQASPVMAQRVLSNPKIIIHWNTVVKDILGEKQVEGVLVHNTGSGESMKIPCKGIFVAIGHSPATELFREQLEMDPQGYIQTACNSPETTLDGVFAAGDCADPVYRQAVTAAGMGCRAAIHAARWLELHPGDGKQ